MVKPLRRRAVIHAEKTLARVRKQSGNLTNPEAREALDVLGKLKDMASPSNLPFSHETPRNFARGPLLTWANVRRLPAEEIATRIALQYLKSSVDARWPRKVTYENFRAAVLDPLSRSTQKGFDGKPVSFSWISQITPESMLTQARHEIASAKS